MQLWMKKVETVRVMMPPIHFSTLLMTCRFSLRNLNMVLTLCLMM